MAEEALLEAHVALLTAQLRYHQEIVRLQPRNKAGSDSAAPRFRRMKFSGDPSL